MISRRASGSKLVAAPTKQSGGILTSTVLCFIADFIVFAENEREKYKLLLVRSLLNFEAEEVAFDATYLFPT